MKRTLSTILLVMLFFMPLLAEKDGHSRGVSFDASAGIGWSTLNYRVQPGSGWLSHSSGDYAVNGHLGINFFFSEYVGLGIGADVTRFGGAFSGNGTMEWADVTDTDGERYTHILNVKKWRERQQYTYVSPQAMLLFAIPAGPVYISGGLGAEYGICLGGSYKGSGVLEHTGYYEPWHLTLSNMAPHGFYETNAFKPSGKLQNGGNQVALVGRLGVLIPLVENLDLTVHGMFKYAFMTGESAGNPKYSGIGMAGGTQPVGFKNDRAGMEEAHYFMSDYTSFINTDYTAGDIRPLMVGLEIGIRYTIPRKKMNRRVPCLCETFN